jgi:hypothetical protein
MCKLCSGIVPFLIIFLQPNLTILHILMRFFQLWCQPIIKISVKMSIVFLLLRTCSFGLLSDCF